MIAKIFWIIRGIIYKLFLGNFKFPSYIGKPIYIRNPRRIFIDKKVRIFPNARIEVCDKKSSIVFEENVSIAQNFHIISGGKQELVIGRNTTISANVFITNTDHEYRLIDIHILDQPLLFKETKIGENCFIGFGAVIQAGTTLGKQCIVGANAVVKGKFPDYSVIVGSPAIIVKRYDLKKEAWRQTNKKGDFLDE